MRPNAPADPTMNQSSVPELSPLQRAILSAASAAQQDARIALERDRAAASPLSLRFQNDYIELAEALRQTTKRLMVACDQTQDGAAKRALDSAAAEMEWALGQLSVLRTTFVKLEEELDAADRESAARGERIQEVGEHLARDPEASRTVLEHGDYDAVVFLLDQNPLADREDVVLQLAERDPVLALRVLLRVRSRTPAFVRPSLWAGLLERAIEADPLRIFRWADSVQLPDELRPTPAQCRLLIDRLSATAPRTAWAILSSGRMERHTQLEEHDHERCFSILARNHPSHAASALLQSRSACPRRIEPDAWSRLFEHFVREHTAAECLYLIDEFPAPADARVSPSLVARLLASPELTSIERVRVMPLTERAASVAATVAPVAATAPTRSSR
jgi:hypothetical protein